MSYKKGDVVLIPFPYTDLTAMKKRPILIISEINSYGDFFCLQITTNHNQVDIIELPIKLQKKSFVKYDKCFTLNCRSVIKKVSYIDNDFLLKLKGKLCEKF